MGKLRKGSQPDEMGFSPYKKRPSGKYVAITTIIGMIAIILVGVVIAIVVDRSNRAKLATQIREGAQEIEAPSDPMLTKNVEDVTKSDDYETTRQAILLMGPKFSALDQITPEVMVGLLENAYVSSAENGGKFAGLSFETGEAETPVAITYGEIYAGTVAPYYCTDTETVEDLISGYFGDAYTLPGPMIAYPEILNDGTKVTEWGEGYTETATGVIDAQISSMQLVGDEMIVKARIKENSDATWIMNFKKNPNSVLGYSLTYDTMIPGSMGITQVHATHADCVTASEAALTRVSSGELKCLSVPAGDTDCAWAREYYYDENDTLVYAFMHDATDGSEDQQMVFVDEYLVLWTVGNRQAMVATDEAGRSAHVRNYYVSEAGGNTNFENWQKFVLMDYRSHRL